MMLPEKLSYAHSAISAVLRLLLSGIIVLGIKTHQ